jgi:hypothetical protein
MIYILSLLFTTSFILYSKWQFIDDRGGVSGKWHPYGAIMRIIAVFTPFLMQEYGTANWKDYLLVGAINIAWWEIGINIIALGQKWWHIGTTAKFDIKLKSKKWILIGILLVVSVLIKIV